MTVKTVPDGGCSGGYACYAPPVSATRDVHYAYDLRGLQLSARFDSASGTDLVSSGWDGFGRQVSGTTAMGGVSRTLTATFDADGNRITLAWPDSVSGSATFTYGYDGLDRMRTIAEPGSGVVATLAYDDNGRRATLTRVGSATATDWFAPGWLRSQADTFAGPSFDVTTRFYDGATDAVGYNPSGQITRRERSNGLYDYAGYAAASTAYQANGLNQYSAVGGTAYGYDSNGNLTGDGAESYRYDAENRLLGTASGGLALVYDPLGRLYETSGGTPGTRRFLYDGDALVAEYDTVGTLAARYVHGPGVDEPLLWYDGTAISTATRRQLHADHQGSIAAIADGGGAGLAVNRYDEWGVPGAGNVGRFQYTGQILLPQIGMYHYKARVYAPRLGRFLQTDPIGYEDQINLYAYALNDPLINRDPTGTQSKTPCAAEDNIGGTCDVIKNDTPKDEKTAKEKYRVTIFVDKESKGVSQAMAPGHAWITVEEEDGTHTYALWPESIAKTGRDKSDILRDSPNDINREPTEGRRVFVSKLQMSHLRSYLNSKQIWNEITNNCTDFAMRAWQIATGEKINAWRTLFINTPSGLDAGLKSMRR